MVMNKKVRCVFDCLPGDIVASSILTCLPMYEVARASIVSHEWNHHWHRIPLLDFKKPDPSLQYLTNQLSTVRWMPLYPHIVGKKRLDFANWVDGILDKHVGSFIDEFDLTFYFDNDHHHHINKWFVWALSRDVKRFHLDLTPLQVSHLSIDDHQLCVLDKPINVKVKPVLTSLCLKCVNVSNEFVEYFLESCGGTLENLLIEKSKQLTCIKGSCASLKYFKVSDCRDLVAIDIQSPNLESFVYEAGFHMNSRLDLLHIGNASSLSHVTIQVPKTDRFLSPLQSLSNYFPHLECLKVKCFRMDTNNQQVLHNLPILTNLKHLELIVSTILTKSIVAWIPFIKACPLLEKITIGHGCWTPIMDSATNVKIEKHTLFHLKTLEIMDFNGRNIDIDFVNFVFENGVSLREMVLRVPKHSKSLNLAAPLDALKIKLPRDVKLVLDYIDSVSN